MIVVLSDHFAASKALLDKAIKDFNQLFFFSVGPSVCLSIGLERVEDNLGGCCVSQSLNPQ